MKHVDEYRDAEAVQRLIAEIGELVTRRHVLMEVCGGQTHGLLRYGIDDALSDDIELIHGPGCPVCVTPAEDIDFAVHLAQQDKVSVASFGDMLRVPGTRRSLNEARAAGGRVRVVYSPVDAVRLAQRNPGQHIVFFAVGFETTAPATALAALQAQRLGLDNFSLLTSHVRVQPAMEALMLEPDNRIDAFLAAGHVCTITGFESYEEFVRRFHLPVAVTGFEPVDLLKGIRDCVRQLEAGVAEVTNQYTRSVHRSGNQHALATVHRVYEIADRPWRGFGVIPGGGFRLRSEFQSFDARHRFRESVGNNESDALPVRDSNEFQNCPAAYVLAGRMRPCDCPHLGTQCTPDNPLGAPMVSSEGACAAYFRYHSTGINNAIFESRCGISPGESGGDDKR